MTVTIDLPAGLDPAQVISVIKKKTSCEAIQLRAELFDVSDKVKIIANNEQALFAAGMVFGEVFTEQVRNLTVFAGE